MECICEQDLTRSGQKDNQGLSIRNWCLLPVFKDLLYNQFCSIWLIRHLWQECYQKLLLHNAVSHYNSTLKICLFTIGFSESHPQCLKGIAARSAFEYCSRLNFLKVCSVEITAANKPYIPIASNRTKVQPMPSFLAEHLLLQKVNISAAYSQGILHSDISRSYAQSSHAFVSISCT